MSLGLTTQIKSTLIILWIYPDDFIKSGKKRITVSALQLLFPVDFKGQKIF